MKYIQIIWMLCFVSPLVAQYEIGHTLIEQDIETNYFLYLPENYNSNDDPLPLLLFLHGGGESGSDAALLTKHGPPKMIADGKEFPFIVLAPQNPFLKKFWKPGMVITLLDRIIADYNVDVNRIYLTGLSRGALGAWMLLMNYPEYFAAAAPICGAAPTAYHMWVPDIPIWIFHGEDDETIPLEESIDIYQKLKATGKNVKLTTYPGTGHDSWTITYENDELYEWFLKHSK